MLNLTVEDLVKIATALGSFGGGLAFARPFAQRAFDRWLDRADREQKAKEDREKAERDREMRGLAVAERSAVTQERVTAVVERIDQRLDRVDQRLDRIEAHHGISPTPSAVPAAPPHVDARASITGQFPAVSADRPLPPDGPPGAPPVPAR